MVSGDSGGQSSSQCSEKEVTESQKKAEMWRRDRDDRKIPEGTEAKKKLRRGKGRAKREAWLELLRTVEQDPRGQPYRVVLGRLRAAVAPITMIMTEEELEETVNELSPRMVDEAIESEERRLLATAEKDWSEEHEITEAKIAEATRRTTRKKTAPSLDGIHGAIMCDVEQCNYARISISIIGGTFNACLSNGIFPGV